MPVPPEEAAELPPPVARRHGLQRLAPPIGAVDVARPQHRPLQIAELVEDEQGMIAGASEMPVEDRAFLPAVGGAVRAVHVEDERLETRALMDPLDPNAREAAQGFEVLLGRQHLGLEAGHLARRGGEPKGVPMADQGAHGRVEPQPLGVVHVVVARQASKDRLPEETKECMLDVLPRTNIDEPRSRRLGQPKGFIEFTESEQSRVRCDRRSPELQLEPPVKIEPKRPLCSFTHWVLPANGQEEGLTH